MQGPGDEKRDEDGGADAPLHEALDDLESMLGPGGIPAAAPHGATAARTPYRDPGREEPADPDSRPGEVSGIVPRSAAPYAAGEAGDPLLYRLAAQRLASEVEIILNARLESALERLGEELRRDLENHIDIVLPEIVSALFDADFPPSDE